MIILLVNMQNIIMKFNKILSSYMNKNEGFSIKKLCKTKKNYLVLTSLFTFLNLIFAFTLTLIHFSWKPIPSFSTFFHLMCHIDMLLKKSMTKANSLQTFLWSKISQLKTNFSALDITLKLDPSSFIKSIIFFLQSYLSIKSIKLQDFLRKW
jgi:hypothetical protein